MIVPWPDVTTANERMWRVRPIWKLRGSVT